MSTKTMKEKATELLQRCEVVVLASVNKGISPSCADEQDCNRGNFYYLDVYRSGLIKDYRLS